MVGFEFCSPTKFAFRPLTEADVREILKLADKVTFAG